MPRKKRTTKIELLSPAGDLPRLKTAIRFGADAVYAGLPDFSLRNPREITFTLKTLKEGMDFVHDYGKKIYITFNVFPHEKDLKKLKKDIKGYFKILKDIDGVIVSDLGMLSLIKKYLPKVPTHISTQANTVNSEAVKMWKGLGAKRVVLARELTLKEIKEIKKKLRSFFAKASKDDLNQKIQIEVFGHGAMCIAYSGRCLLSKYYTNREANLGDCAQSCRWRYRLKNQKSNLKNQNYGVPSGRYYIEEELRLNDLVEVQEDERGTYFLNSKEICTLDILDKFIESGIDALKIEGRAKSVYYVASVTRIYRKAIDAYYDYQKRKKAIKPSNPAGRQQSRKAYNQKIKELYKELNLVSNRGYSHGFLLGKEEYEQNYETTAIKPPIVFCGVILGSDLRIRLPQKKEINKNVPVGSLDPTILVEVKNKFKVGEKIEIITPDKIYKTKVSGILNVKKKEIEEALTPQDKVWLVLSGAEGVKLNNNLKIPEGSIVRKIQ